MKFYPAYRWSTAVVCVATMLVAGCASSEDGPYAPSKQSWDEPHSAEQLAALGDRLKTTQRDN